MFLHQFTLHTRTCRAIIGMLSESGQKRMLAALVEMLEEVRQPSGGPLLSTPSTIIALEGVKILTAMWI